LFILMRRSILKFQFKSNISKFKDNLILRFVWFVILK
jgi:hypothetical protein